MNLKVNLPVWVALLGILSFVSCAKDSATEISPLSNLEENQKELTKIPYANKSDLEQFSSNEKIVDYNMNTHAILEKDFVTYTLYRK